MNYYYIIEGKIRNNIGDILQGMAAAQYLPQFSMPVDRESLSDLNPHQPAFMISNGWYMHDFSKFPPPDSVYPLYVSVHIANSNLLKSKLVRDHFRKFAPIGCRDKKTLLLFLGWGIPAYFSGCLTITIQKLLLITPPKNENILMIDNIDHPVPGYIFDKLETLYKSKIIKLNHNPEIKEDDFCNYVRTGRKQMEDLLVKYCSAKLIITTKIHCALPCIGMGVPVILIHPNPSDPRLYTVRQFIRIISYSQLMKLAIPPEPHFRINRINKQKDFLKNVVVQSVQQHINIIRHPTTIYFHLIKIKSHIASLIYHFIIIFLLRFNISSQVKKIYGAN